MILERAGAGTHLYFSFLSGYYILIVFGRLRRFGALFGAFRELLGAYWSWMTPRPQNSGAFSKPSRASDVVGQPRQRPTHSERPGQIEM